MRQISRNMILPFLTYAALACCGCSGDQQTDASTVSTEQEVVSDSSQMHPEFLEDLLYSLPSPMVVVSGLKQSGAVYSQKNLNNPNDVSGYTTNYSQALNMGVYCTDMLYAVFFNQTQYALNIMDAQQKIGADLGVSELMNNENIYGRFQKNLGNKDSALAVIGEILSSSNEHFRDNKNYEVAALVIAGGWIEGLYLATNQLNIEKSPVLMEQVAQQHAFAGKLVELMTPFKNNPQIVSLTEQLKSLNEIFSKVNTENINVQDQTDEKNKVTTIGATTRVVLSQELLKEIKEKNNQIRSQITKISA